MIDCVFIFMLFFTQGFELYLRPTTACSKRYSLLLINRIILMTTFMRRFVLLERDGQISWETGTLFCITTRKKTLR